MSLNPVAAEIQSGSSGKYREKGVILKNIV